MKTVIREGIKEGGDLLKTLLTGKRAVEIKDDGSVEVSDIPRKLTPIKIFIMMIFTFIIGLGGWALIKMMDELIKLISWMQAYSSYILAITPVLSLLILLVGGSGIIRKTKWSKDQ